MLLRVIEATYARSSRVLGTATRNRVCKYGMRTNDRTCFSYRAYMYQHSSRDKFADLHSKILTLDKGMCYTSNGLDDDLAVEVYAKCIRRCGNEASMSANIRMTLRIGIGGMSVTEIMFQVILCRSNSSWMYGRRRTVCSYCSRLVTDSCRSELY